MWDLGSFQSQMLNVSTGSGFWRTTARLAAFLGRKWFVFTRKSRMPSSALTQSPSTSTTLNPTGILPVLRSIPQMYYQYFTHSTSTTLNPTDILPVLLNSTDLLPVLHTQYQYYAQSHRYITSTTHTVPVLHPHYLIPQLSVLHSIPQVYYQYYTQFQH